VKLSTAICKGVIAGALVAGAVAVLTGCQSPATQNRKIYDRYAELVAARNAAAGTTTATAPSATVTSPTSAPARTAPVVSPARTGTPTAKPTPPSPPKKTPSQPPARVAPTPPPVQVIAQATPKPPAPAPTPPPEPPARSPSADGGSDVASAYRLKVGDNVQVFLRGIPTADAIQDIVDEEGMVSLPFINDVSAVGLTTSELEKAIRQTYLDQDIYRNITVNVVVPTRFYYVQGEVRGPGKFQILTSTSVSQAIAAAGGYTEYASGKVLIKRNGVIFKTIRNARRLDRTPQDDILIEPDDVVEVLRSFW
jgi:protein involved in polysaccharide export with SLBB domain